MPTSSSVDWPVTLPLPLVGPPRTLQPRSEIHVMESQRIRVRRYFEDYREFLDLEWAFTADEFEEFKAFFEDDLCNGQNPFTIVLLDVEDSSLTITTDYAFFEATYQFTYSDNVYNVTATAIVEEELGVAIPEVTIDLCAVVIWPSVSSGSGGGTTFDCYDVGDYTSTAFEVKGTGLSAIYQGRSPFAMQGEPFEIFSDGNLVLGSPSSNSGLNTMYYGNPEFSVVLGDPFEDYTAGTHTEGPLGVSTTGIDAYYLA